MLSVLRCLRGGGGGSLTLSFANDSALPAMCSIASRSCGGASAIDFALKTLASLWLSYIRFEIFDTSTRRWSRNVDHHFA